MTCSCGGSVQAGYFGDWCDQFCTAEYMNRMLLMLTRTGEVPADMAPVYEARLGRLFNAKPDWYLDLPDSMIQMQAAALASRARDGGWPGRK